MRWRRVSFLSLQISTKTYSWRNHVICIWYQDRLSDQSRWSSYCQGSKSNVTNTSPEIPFSCDSINTIWSTVSEDKMHFIPPFQSNISISTGCTRHDWYQTKGWDIWPEGKICCLFFNTLKIVFFFFWVMANSILVEHLRYKWLSLV